MKSFKFSIFSVLAVLILLSYGSALNAQKIDHLAIRDIKSGQLLYQDEERSYYLTSGERGQPFIAAFHDAEIDENIIDFTYVGPSEGTVIYKFEVSKNEQEFFNNHLLKPLLKLAPDKHEIIIRHFNANALLDQTKYSEDFYEDPLIYTKYRAPEEWLRRGKILQSRKKWLGGDRSLDWRIDYSEGKRYPFPGPGQARHDQYSFSVKKALTYRELKSTDLQQAQKNVVAKNQKDKKQRPAPQKSQKLVQKKSSRLIDIREAKKAFSKRDFQRAFQIYMSHAESSRSLHRAEAQYWVCRLYGRGFGVERDDKQAVYWCRESALAGHPDAHKALLRLYERGEGVKHPQKAFLIKQYLAKSGKVEDQLVLADAYMSGDGVKEDKSKALAIYEKYAKAGDADTQSKLGRLYSRSYEKYGDLKKAFYWTEKAARQGVSNAQYDLGKMYQTGRGTKKNEQRAYFWIEYAAQQGESFAQYDLGKMYQTGRGTEKNEQQAKFWLEKAAKKGLKKAQVALVKIKEKDKSSSVSQPNQAAQLTLTELAQLKSKTKEIPSSSKSKDQSEFIQAPKQKLEVLSKQELSEKNDSQKSGQTRPSYCESLGKLGEMILKSRMQGAAHSKTKRDLFGRLYGGEDGRQIYDAAYQLQLSKSSNDNNTISDVDGITLKTFSSKIVINCLERDVKNIGKPKN